MSSQYTIVTEIPGQGATAEQIAMLHTRYGIAGKLAHGKDVLEVACGAGIGLRYLAQTAKRVVAGDLDHQMAGRAAAHRTDCIGVIRMDAQQLPVANRSFDVLLLLEGLYYLPDPVRFLRDAQRVLRDDGVLFMCLPNREWDGFHPSPLSHRYYSIRELEELLRQTAFRADAYVGFGARGRQLRDRILLRMRKIAVRLGLIPTTMRGKAALKRLLFGRLEPIPESLLGRDLGTIDELVPIDQSETVRDYKVLYVFAHPVVEPERRR